MTQTSGETSGEEGGEDSRVAWLINYLRERDVPCPLCGYNLRRLESARCPECGQEIGLRINLAEPHLRGWITAVVTLCASAGIGVITLAISSQEGLPPLRRHLALGLSLYAFMASIVPAIVVVWARRRFLRLERRTQGMVACACVVLLACELAAFFAGLQR